MFNEYPKESWKSLKYPREITYGSLEQAGLRWKGNTARKQLAAFRINQSRRCTTFSYWSR